jgi:hypothetical protein
MSGMLLVFHALIPRSWLYSSRPSLSASRLVFPRANPVIFWLLFSYASGVTAQLAKRLATQLVVHF